MSSDPPVLGCWSQHIHSGYPQAFWGGRSSHLGSELKAEAQCRCQRGFFTWSGQILPRNVREADGPGPDVQGCPATVGTVMW